MVQENNLPKLEIGTSTAENSLSLSQVPCMTFEKTPCCGKVTVIPTKVWIGLDIIWHLCQSGLIMNTGFFSSKIDLTPS